MAGVPRWYITGGAATVARGSTVRVVAGFVFFLKLSSDTVSSSKRLARSSSAVGFCAAFAAPFGGFITNETLLGDEAATASGVAAAGADAGALPDL